MRRPVGDAPGPVWPWRAARSTRGTLAAFDGVLEYVERLRQPTLLSGILPATERLSEPERTLILAILATRLQPSRLVLVPTYTLARKKRRGH